MKTLLGRRVLKKEESTEGVQIHTVQIDLKTPKQKWKVRNPGTRVDQQFQRSIKAYMDNAVSNKADDDDGVHTSGENEDYDDEAPAYFDEFFGMFQLLQQTCVLAFASKKQKNKTMTNNNRQTSFYLSKSMTQKCTRETCLLL